ncbi:hypothetical protein BH11PLA1_BH11PLA1_03920 [soil metagenome]
MLALFAGASVSLGANAQPATPAPSQPAAPALAKPAAAPQPKPAAAVPASPAVPSAVIQLRAGADSIRGTLGNLSPAGVRIIAAPADAGPPAERTISWDLIRDIEVDGKSLPEIAPFRTELDALWRGRSRLERSDYALAERALTPLYDRCESGALTLTGPSGAVLFEGILRSRLNRGWTTAAVTPWLEWRTVQEVGGRLGLPAVDDTTRADAQGAVTAANAWVGGVIAGPQVLSRTLGLCTLLPPMFSTRGSTRALPVLAQAPIWERILGQRDAAPSTAAIAELYLFALRAEIARAESSEIAPLPSRDKSRTLDPGTALISDIVLSRAGTSPQRIESRAALERRLIVQRSRSGDDTPAPPLEPWQEAWVHAALGRSLLVETDPRLKRQGLVHLLHVPARFGATQPFLAALALQDAIDALRAMGDADGANQLNQDLVARLGDFASDDSFAALPAPPVAPSGAGSPTIPPEPAPGDAPAPPAAALPASPPAPSSPAP